jgi:hypothetical protein
VPAQSGRCLTRAACGMQLRRLLPDVTMHKHAHSGQFRFAKTDATLPITKGRFVAGSALSTCCSAVQPRTAEPTDHRLPARSDPQPASLPTLPLPCDPARAAAGGCDAGFGHRAPPNTARFHLSDPATEPRCSVAWRDLLGDWGIAKVGFQQWKTVLTLSVTAARRPCNQGRTQTRPKNKRTAWSPPRLS